jgi:hypothetical protein
LQQQRREVTNEWHGHEQDHLAAVCIWQWSCTSVARSRVAAIRGADSAHVTRRVNLELGRGAEDGRRQQEREKRAANHGALCLFTLQVK